MRRLCLAMCMVVSVMSLGGCLSMFGEISEEEHAERTLMSVNEYTGEEYRLRGGQATNDLAQELFPDIEEAVQAFFREEYKTDVIVHNAVGASGGATVFVESVGEPHFHTFAIIPIDTENKRVRAEDVWTEEGQVEQSLFGGLLAMIMEDEFKALEEYLVGLTKEYPVVGFRQEAVNNVIASGYTTPYFFIQPLSMDELEGINQLYLDNPDIRKEELREHFDVESYEANDLSITVELFMSEPKMDPDEEIFNMVVHDLETMEGIPRGAYAFLLRDNNVIKRTGTGNDRNYLRRNTPNKIIRD
ncbi:DUF1672 family protein [Halalkalibacter sp. APA_J-10(15)]|uniref:DUF1672 family protein n=1 Tax=Halalkalibacter sp. APA_J-10(15) TaxID=2933805 RepID=UPI001FF46639|nr:DUF1672 family protein [Halalkalibacter sp. APA_J-10(15)]MCK0473389.1 DUF1672 domain-containing protein [Halalkalibacter sp. APA_J-10(15)]